MTALPPDAIPDLGWRGADVLVLSPTPTHPQDYGNRNRIFSVCSQLARRGARLTFVHYPAEAEWRSRVPEAAAAAMAAAWHACYTVPVTRPLHSSPHGEDHTIDEWWDEAIERFLRWLFRVSHFDVFIVNYSWLSKALEVAPRSVVKILDTHDRFADRRAVLARLGIAPEYFHTTDEEETIALNRADIVWAIKDQERAHFETLTSAPVLTLSHLDAPRPLPALQPDPEGYLRVGVIGGRNNINLLNLRDFLAAAVPVFERFCAPIMIYVAGSLCDWLDEVDERFVRLVGRVEDVADFYRRVDVACIPMRFSTGLKTKTGEAIAFGLPVVCLDHGFEGYVAHHPFHTLASFEEMAERLVDIAFERGLISDLRAASLRSAQASRAGIVATIERTWQIIRQTRRTIVYCVAAGILDREAPEHCAFVSSLNYMKEIADIVVLVVTQPIERLLASGSQLDSPAPVIVAAELVDDEAVAAALAEQGYAVAAIEEVLTRFDRTMVVCDALSEALLAIPPMGGCLVLRAEMVAQKQPLEPRLAALTAFLQKFARPVVMAARTSPVIGRLVAGAEADAVTAPCCWRSEAARRQLGRRRRGEEVLLLSDGRLRGLAELVRSLADREVRPLLVGPEGIDLERLMAKTGAGATRPVSARDYLSALIGGRCALPQFAIDLSFGALGLQYLRELLLRLDVPVIMADAAVLHPSIAGSDGAACARTYEGVVAKIVAAAQGQPVLNDSHRRRLETELDGDGGWAWLWRYGFDVLA